MIDFLHDAFNFFVLVLAPMLFVWWLSYEPFERYSRNRQRRKEERDREIESYYK